VDLGQSSASRWLGSLRTWRDGPEQPAQAQPRDPAILRLISPVALVTMVATIAGIALGFVLARQADESRTAGHRQALVGAIEALQAVAPEVSPLEPRMVRLLERASGLKGLKYEADPADGGRAIQSLMDHNGRIVGWLSWDAERPAIEMMLRLLPIAGLVAAGVIGLAGLIIWQLRRMGHLLADRDRAVRLLEFQDALTGLPNRRQMFALLEQGMAARSADQTVAFVFLDLDRFDELTDTIGSVDGDEVVVEIANRLRRAVSPGTVIGCLGGGKFALMITAGDYQSAPAIVAAASEIIADASWINHIVQTSASIGLAIAPRDGVTPEVITRRADLALRAAKRGRRGLIILYAPEIEADFQERRFLKCELARALAEQSFDVNYQPIVKADGGAMVGVEALLRWNHATRGFIPPSVFVPIAEQAGLMDKIGEFVLRRALTDALAWPHLYIAINLSPIQIRERHFISLVSRALKETKIEPSRVVLEITEGELIDNPDVAKTQLQELRALGVRLALDDFGVGYSSLTYLQRLPFDKLKIDRGFVDALEHSANAGVIIQAIVALGRALGMSIVIEGVETEEQRVLLRLAGCNEMQGFLFARPGPREDIDRLLREGTAASLASSPRRTVG
jgi:diguanylate cyclase (GGDEF)-like protein